ncbi:MAG TPA: hypothetical protein VFN53_08930 [Acidobacteriaceae bacterium]|nr:hypothetical protein [Acidobacteriaceae bacterium]
MTGAAQLDLLPASEIARAVPLQTSTTGIRYAVFGDIQMSSADLERIILAVPRSIVAALSHKVYYFVPLVVTEGCAADFGSGKTNPVLIAREYTPDSGDKAVCHRNVNCGGTECVFISTRLMQDRFALAFEFYINIGHHFVDAAGVPERFADLVWNQAVSEVRGETSQDAWEQRAKARGKSLDSAFEHTWSGESPAGRLRSKVAPFEQSGNSTLGKATPAVDEKARAEYMEAAFADAIAIYLLSMTVDFDYTELREREYPLLGAPALAERLRHIAQIFPANAGHEFSIRYRRRNR